VAAGGHQPSPVIDHISPISDHRSLITTHLVVRLSTLGERCAPSSGGFMNTTIITGHLVANPDPRFIGEKVVLNGTIAHNHVYRDKEGQRQEEPVFLDFEAWNGLAETMCKHLTTKRKVLLCGRLKLRRWEDEKGKHSRLSLVVDSLEFMDAPGRDAPEEAVADAS
jgi:single-strand DNA-binding protein